MRTLPLLACTLATATACGSVDTPTEPDAVVAAPDAVVAAPDAVVAEPDASTCVAERCNGVDDNCDDVIDEGCPVDGPLGAGGRTFSGLYGGDTTYATANTGFTLTCPLGSALVGIHGRAAESIDAFGASCGNLTVQHGGVDPYDYQVVVGAGDSLPVQGGPGGSSFDSQCPAGKLVTGARLWTATNGNGASIYGIALVCSRLGITGTVGGFALTLGASEELARVATGNAGLPPIEEVLSCPGVAIADRVTGYYGPWPIYGAFVTVNGLEGSCVAPTLSLISP